MRNEKSMIRDLTQGNVMSQLLRFSAPFLLANALQMAYSMVDMIIIGQFSGTAGLSAIASTSNFVWMVSALGLGFSNGGQILISQLVGAGDKKGISETIGTLFTTVLTLSVIFGACAVLFAGTFVDIMNTPANATKQAWQYTVICAAGSPFTYGYNMVSATLRGMGDSKRPLLFIAIASVINVIGDLVLVKGLGMGADGAAYATVFGQMIAFVISIVYLYRRRESFGFDFRLKSFRPVADKLRLLVKLGIPMALQSAAISVSMMFITSFVNDLGGETASSMFGIGNKINNLMYVVTNAMSTAGATMVGQNIGAGKQDRVPSVCRSMFVICGVACLVFGALVFFFPEAVFGVFTPDQAVLAECHRYSRVVVAFFVTFALMTPPVAVITGVGHSLLNFSIAIADGVVGRIGLSLLMGLTFRMGLYGFYWGNALAGFISVLWAGAYYFSGRWRQRKRIIDR